MTRGQKWCRFWSSEPPSLKTPFILPVRASILIIAPEKVIDIAHSPHKAIPIDLQSIALWPFLPGRPHRELVPSEESHILFRVSIAVSLRCRSLNDYGENSYNLPAGSTIHRMRSNAHPLSGTKCIYQCICPKISLQPSLRVVFICISAQ